MSEPASLTKAKPNMIGKPPLERADNLLGLVTKTLAIVGAVGTAFVWVTANFYVGDVELRSDSPLVDGVVVKVYDRRGQEGTFHGSRFQLMPGDYHLEIVEPSGKLHHQEATVKFHEVTVVPVSASTDSDGRPAGGKDKRHWWQFWRS